MIPERVETITSVTCMKNRTFQTPVGRFTYWSVPIRAYWIGIDRIDLAGDRGFLMATREKALADRLCQDRGNDVRSHKRLEAFLLEDLRIDPETLGQLDPVATATIAEHWGSRRVAMLASYLRKRRSRASE